jgi:hypothetical protein
VTPRIRSVTAEPVRVTPAEAVVVVRVELDGPPAGADLRGKLVGPRRPGATTVEVAYPLRPADGDPPTLRAVIPEPNLWTPAAPFRYDGTVELWRGGAKLDAKPFTVHLPANPGRQ